MELVIIPTNELKQLIADALAEHDAQKRNELEQTRQKETLFTINKVAHRLGRAHNTIKSLVNKGAIKTTSDRLISEKAINDYLRTT